MLSVPSGPEAICVALQEGTYPIRANYLEIGSRRPLGVGAGSLALFAWMPDREIEALMPMVAARLERFPRITRRVLEDHIEQSRKRGYAMILDLIVERMGGIAMPILGADGRPVARSPIAALTERITSREEALAAALKREVAECVSAWRHGRRTIPIARRRRTAQACTPTRSMRQAYIAGAGNTSIGRTREAARST
jgi:DNA-binding IclR family transcriptional regulator